MNSKRFTERHGFAPAASEIAVIDDAPTQIREAILIIAEGEIHLRPSAIREILCTVLRRMPNGNNWSDYPNVWAECHELMDAAPWYRVYDFVEAVYEHLEDSRKKRDLWAQLVNNYFVESGVGWRMVDGFLERRGEEGFIPTVDKVREALEKKRHKTAHNEIQEALRDLSRRPEPDLTGAIQHSIAALECVAREAVDDPKATLGEILKFHPDLVPKPLDDGLVKMWGYSSEFARHLREGRVVTRQEAELVVTVSSAVCTYLATVKCERINEE